MDNLIDRLRSLQINIELDELTNLVDNLNIKDNTDVKNLISNISNIDLDRENESLVIKFVNNTIITFNLNRCRLIEKSISDITIPRWAM